MLANLLFTWPLSWRGVSWTGRNEPQEGMKPGQGLYLHSVGLALPHLIPSHNVKMLGGRRVVWESVEHGGETDL